MQVDRNKRLYFVYILYSKKLDRFYVGRTKNLYKRLEQHNRGDATYTSPGTPWLLIWSAPKYSARAAFTLEFKIKNLNRKRKMKFMWKYDKGIRDAEVLKEISRK